MSDQGTNEKSRIFPDEVRHLEETQQLLETALKAAREDVERIDRDYREAKRYMAEYRGELDPNEMFQNELLLKQTDQIGAFSAGIYERLLKQMESPYFARIDFMEKDETDAEKIYIGRYNFRHGRELVIFDWRAPVAGMFYDYEVGPAGYEAPVGRIEGEMVRKRQFKIENGALKYTLETASRIQDDVLQRELSQTSDEKMKSIIATIQKDQNRIIRNEKSKTLIIQGVAGSGKTSIALHRIAYLLYRFKDRLRAENVAILSPNRVFGDYISNVIPELGEEPVNEMSLSDIAETALNGIIGFVPDSDPLEHKDGDWIERRKLKSAPEFLGLLNRYTAELPDRIFVPQDIEIGSLKVEKEWIRRRFLTYGRYPVKQRLSMAAEDIRLEFENGNRMQEDLPGVKDILKRLDSMLTLKSPLALYRDFYRTAGIPDMLVLAEKKTLEWGDVFPFLYLLDHYTGLRTGGAVKHLVIDEMQDYSPVQYAVINRIFPCTKTILGDFGQSMNPCHSYTLKDLQQIYEDAELVILNKSYRSTYEIITFAGRIQKNSAMEPVERHGAEPEIIRCKNSQDEDRKVRAAIRSFRQGSNKSLCIIVKTDAEAERLMVRLSGESDINLISPQSAVFKAGVSVSSIRMAKGLEFDEVILPGTDNVAYASEYDRSLLYIACTRAMHRLTILYTGMPSCFISSADEW